MSKMTFAWLAIYVVGAFSSFINPLYGTLTYLFEYYLRPSLHWWGKAMPDLRWNFTIAAILTLTFVLRRGSLPEMPTARRAPALCLVGLAALMMLVTPLAVDPGFSWIRTIDFLKLILFFGLIVGTVRSEWAFDLFVATHIAGAGWWGWEAFVDPKREGGRLANIGSGDTLGDNFAAAHLLTVIPFLVVYALVHKDKRLKMLAVATAPFIINAFILCNSRGSMVGLAAAVMAALIITKSGHRLRMVGAGIGLAAALFVLADPEFIARQQTTTSYADSSATERLATWQGSLALVKDYPFGAGGGGFPALSPVYISAVVDSHQGEQRDPHNTFVLVATEWGLIGLALYLGYYASCYLVLRQVRKRAPEGGIWYYRSVGVQLSMVGIFVAGAFSDRLYAEAPYWMGALAVALHRLQTAHLARVQPVSESSEPEPVRFRMPTAAARVVTP